MEKLQDNEKEFLLTNYNHLENSVQIEIVNRINDFFDKRFTYCFRHSYGMSTRIYMLEHLLQTSGYKTATILQGYQCIQDPFINYMHVAKDISVIPDLIRKAYRQWSIMRRKEKFPVDHNSINRPFSKSHFTKMVELYSFAYKDATPDEDFNETLEHIEEEAIKYEKYFQLVYDSDYTLLTDIIARIKSTVLDIKDTANSVGVVRKDLIVSLAGFSKIFVDELEGLDCNPYEIFPLAQLIRLYPLHSCDFEHFFNNLFEEKDLAKFADLIDFQTPLKSNVGKLAKGIDIESVYFYRGFFTEDLIASLLKHCFSENTDIYGIDLNPNKKALMMYMYEYGEKYPISLKLSSNLNDKLGFRYVIEIDGIEYVLFTVESRSDLFAITKKSTENSKYFYEILQFGKSSKYEYTIKKI